ncbi:MAG: hypothetical protein HYY45_19750 [Deltaproteobacteria bacterium]|nr:hypothetical protein [Deltaproteobacteria bacterium]
MIILPPFIRHLIKLALLAAVFWAPLYTAPQLAEAAASPGLRLRAWEIVQEAPKQSAVEPAASPQAEPAASPQAEPAASPRAEPATSPRAEPATSPQTWAAISLQAVAAASPQAEKLKVKIKAIRITGAVVITPEELNPVIAPYIGQDMSLADLQKIADLITEEYRNRGYNLARALVPEQEIKDGVVEIKVLEARIGEIKIEGNRYFSTDLIRRALRRVEVDRAVKQTSLEKSLLLLNDNPDVKATASLQAGAEDGTTDIVLKVEDTLPVHLTLDYNNFGNRFVSRHVGGAELNLGDPWYGSLLSLGGTFGGDPQFTTFKRANYTLPINNYGTKFGGYYNEGTFDVGGQFRTQELEGIIHGWGLFLTHPFIRTRFTTLRGEFGFDLKDALLNSGKDHTSRDRIRLVKAGFNFDLTDSTGRTFVSAYVFHGLGDLFGGSSDKRRNPVNTIPSSRRGFNGKGADGDFTYGTVTLARVQGITSFLSLFLRTSGQISSASLVATEQFGIGGPNSVRGYTQREIVADEGFNASSELRLSVIPESDLIQLVSFIDYGSIHQREPAQGQDKFQSLLGYGPGLRLSLPLNLSFRFDVGFPITPSENQKKIDPVYYLQASIKY